MKHFLFFDEETRSAVDLEVAGAWHYASDSTTEVLCVGYARDNTGPEIWTPGQPVPQEFVEAAKNPDWYTIAHNHAFERAISTHILEPCHGWPHIPLERQICSMTLALASALPGGLEAAAQALGLDYQKDRGGYAAMRKMAKPRRPHKGEDPKAIYWIDSPELRERLHRYCMRDVEIERAVARQLPLLPAFENKLFRLDATINARGFCIDTALAQAARHAAKAAQTVIKAEVAALTNGQIVSINQVAKIKDFVRAHGHTLASLTKRSVSAVLAHETSDQVRQLLELRREGARASTAKLDRLLKSVDNDNRLRGTLRFHASSTGRWSGRGYQPQNLKKPETKDLDAAVAAVLSGDAARIRALGPALTIVGDVSRAMIRAAPGHILVSGDFSAIESRVLSWLSGETWKLENYRQHDTTKRAELEPYCATASRIFKRIITPDDEDARGIGKVCDLAFGFGGGLGAWRKFDNSEAYTDVQVEEFKANWRREHPATVRFWRRLERVVHRTVFSGNQHELGNVVCHMRGEHLLLTLPSGRHLTYPRAHLGPGKFKGTRELRFKDNAKGGWADCSAWYGQLTENVVQAVARDLLAAAMLRLDAAGYPIVLHVHDEIVCEVAESFDRQDEFQALLTALPDWAEGLPVAAKIRAGVRYVKTQAAPTELKLPDETELAPAEPTIAVSDSTPGSDAPVVPEPPAEADEAAELPALVDLIGEPLTDGFILCPFHDDTTPSLRVYDDHYHCFACGAHGSHVDWLIQVQEMSEREALDLLSNWDGPTVARPSEADHEEKLRRALRIWEEARPIAGTPAQRYLVQHRRIDVAGLPADIDATLRFHPRCPFKALRQPCLLALLRDPLTDAPTGIHRTALGPDDNRVERRLLGKLGAVKLWPAASQLVVGEGIETTLAGALHKTYLDAPLRPAWALIAAGYLGRLPVLPDVERLIILIDHDEAGQAAATHIDRQWTRAGRTVVHLMPEQPGLDFNDLILVEAAA